MPLHRRDILAAAASVVLPGISAAQTALPQPTPRAIKRAEWAATPLWQARIEARQDFVIAEASVVRRMADGLILLVREEPLGIGGQIGAQHVRLERRDAAGRMVWQHPVPGLPGRFGVFVARYVAGSGGQHSLLAMTFLPADNRRAALYGRIVEVDEGAGHLRALGGIARPRTREWIEDDVFEFHGALRLGGNRLALYGGFGSGPYQWWLAVVRLDGTLLWQTMGHTSAGEVTSMRVVSGGYEASVHIIMAWPNTANVGIFRMRFDEGGRLVGSVKLDTWRGLLFMPDGSAVTLGEEPRRLLEVEDRLGHRRTIAALPSATHLKQRLDDGSFALYEDGDYELIVAGNGRDAVRVELDSRYESVLADGSILAAACIDENACTARTLALYRRPW